MEKQWGLGNWPQRTAGGESRSGSRRSRPEIAPAARQMKIDWKRHSLCKAWLVMALKKNRIYLVYHLCMTRDKPKYQQLFDAIEQGISSGRYSPGQKLPSEAALEAPLYERYRIPRDVRIVGIDDVQYAKLLPVSLTTVHQLCREIGEAAASAMLERLEMPHMPARDILLNCRLVVRDSCGANDLPQSPRQ